MKSGSQFHLLEIKGSWRLFLSMDTVLRCYHQLLGGRFKISKVTPSCTRDKRDNVWVISGSMPAMSNAQQGPSSIARMPSHGKFIACILPVVSISVLCVIGYVEKQLSIITNFMATFSFALAVMTSTEMFDIFLATAVWVHCACRRELYCWISQRYAAGQVVVIGTSRQGTSTGSNWSSLSLAVDQRTRVWGSGSSPFYRNQKLCAWWEILSRESLDRLPNLVRYDSGTCELQTLLTNTSTLPQEHLPSCW